MKRIILITSFILLSLSAFAQDGKALYNKYSDNENVSAVYISPAMFKMIGKLPDVNINDENLDLSEFVRSLDGMYIIDSENQQINAALANDVEKLVKSENCDILMEIKDKGETVRIYTSGKGEEVTSFILLASEKTECTFICISGSMSRKDLEKLLAQ